MLRTIGAGFAVLVLSLGLAAVPDNTLLFMYDEGPATLDPGVAYEVGSGEYVENIYETLVTFKGKSATEFEGLLATRWTVSSDGRVFTFTLRPNVRFHSGNAFTCADAQYSLRRNLVTNSAVSGVWFTAETLLGTASNAKDDPSITWARITAAVRCNAQNQLVLTLPKRDPSTIAKLAFYGNSIVDSRHAASIGEWDGTERTWKDWIGKDLTDSALSNKPSGTGAYQLVRKEVNTVVLRAFANYWGGRPKIENVIFQAVAEQSSRQEALKKGDADWAGTGPRAVLDQFKGLPNLKILDGLPNNSAGGWALNQNIQTNKYIGSGKLDGNGIPPNFFSDLNLRKAFNYSWNPERIASEITKSILTRRTMILPDSFLGYDPTIPLYKFNAEEATRYFKLAWNGQVWSNGFLLKWGYSPNSPESKAIADLFKNTLEQINPKFRLDLVPITNFNAQYEEIQAGQWPIANIGWIPDYADPDNFIHVFYHSEGYYSKVHGFKDAQMDAWIEEARQTENVARRKQLYSQIGRRAYDLVPYITTNAAVGFFVYNSKLRGLEENLNPMRNGVLWRFLSKAP